MCLAAKRMTSYASAATTGISRTRDAISNGKRGRPKNEYTTIVIDHHRQQEVGPAAHVLGGEALRGLGRDLDVVLVGGDRLVLGAVVLEHPPDVGQAADERRGSR